jgi:hypothetical protein
LYIFVYLCFSSSLFVCLFVPFFFAAIFTPLTSFSLSFILFRFHPHTFYSAPIQDTHFPLSASLKFFRFSFLSML